MHLVLTKHMHRKMRDSLRDDSFTTSEFNANSCVFCGQCDRLYRFSCLEDPGSCEIKLSQARTDTMALIWPNLSSLHQTIYTKEYIYQSMHHAYVGLVTCISHA
ncbi:uncharacterized protein [Elaeis guineensis]|uniref:uncharacterized protein n=1 Tax=Elaeis guineensis var. tenera TaxID=51953 RepID=UPI003C6CDA41